MDVKIKKRNKEEYVEDLGVYIADCFTPPVYREGSVNRVDGIVEFLARLTETLVLQGIISLGDVTYLVREESTKLKELKSNNGKNFGTIDDLILV